MVNHTQTIRRQFADELFECFWPFCEVTSIKFYKSELHFFKAFATIIDKALERLSSYIDNNYINKASKKMMT